jgi:peptidoglycan hydrolase-like protein with peptidoglycan-binding domain
MTTSWRVTWLGVAGLRFGLALAVAAGCAHTHAPPPAPAAVPPTKPDHEQAAETGLTMASTPQGLMRDGAEERLQARLRAKRLLPAGHHTGQLDAETREALRRYQKSEGLPATGLPSYETVRHLDLDLDSIFRTVTPSSPGAPAAAAAARGRRRD